MRLKGRSSPSIRQPQVELAASRIAHGADRDSHRDNDNIGQILGLFAIAKQLLVIVSCESVDSGRAAAPDCPAEYG